ncbi:MAG: acyl-CoA dehydrogenase family protein [Candidatus Coatesbacteria bacterium]|nr:MAG: acyl-CoA dehydrogenase family protein [Candidatus Coatesbacteria bacterium]
MLDYSSYDEFREEIRAKADEIVAPHAAAIDAEDHIPDGVMKAVAQEGWFGATAPEAYGGLAWDTVRYSIMVEEVSRASGSVGVMLAVQGSLIVYPLQKYGTPEQVEHYMPGFASGEVLGSFALTEPGAGSDAGNTKTTAVLDGEEWVINGQKCFITNTKRDWPGICFATVRTDPDPSAGVRGVSSLVVPAETPGFNYGRKENKMGLHGSDTSEIFFEDCRVPKDSVLGELNEGFKLFMVALDAGRISIGAMAVGLGQAALDLAIKHAETRHQFGKPLGVQQAIQWKIAEMATKVRAARFLVYSAAARKDAGLPYTTEAAMAKYYAAEVGRLVASDAVQIHGGLGYDKSYPLERIYRDVKLDEIGEGTSEIQKIVIGRNLINLKRKT